MKLVEQAFNELFPEKDLENYNLKIEFEGAGKVIFQSVTKGERIDKYEVIKIKLS